MSQNAKRSITILGVLLLAMVIAAFLSRSPRALSSEQSESPPLDQSQPYEKLLTDSDLIVVGTIREIGPAPAGWSGGATSYQAVTYSVVDVLKGRWPLSEIVIHYPVVANSTTGKPSSEKPGLNERVFRVDHQYIATANIARHRDYYYVLRHGHSNVAPKEATPDTIQVTREKLERR